MVLIGECDELGVLCEGTVMRFTVSVGIEGRLSECKLFLKASQSDVMVTPNVNVSKAAQRRRVRAFIVGS